jgi:hypothetical protein
MSLIVNWYLQKNNIIKGDMNMGSELYPQYYFKEFMYKNIDFDKDIIILSNNQKLILGNQDRFFAEKYGKKHIPK